MKYFVFLTEGWTLWPCDESEINTRPADTQFCNERSGGCISTREWVGIGLLTTLHTQAFLRQVGKYTCFKLLYKYLIVRLYTFIYLIDLLSYRVARLKLSFQIKASKIVLYWLSHWEHDCQCYKLTHEFRWSLLGKNKSFK